MVDPIVESTFGYVTAIRKLDVLLGDRPWQLRNPEGNVGVAVDRGHLEPSPVQDDTVEIVYDRPYGKCLSEKTYGSATHVLTIVTYEEAVQVAITEQPDGEKVVATRTFRGTGRHDRADLIRTKFLNDDDIDELVMLMAQEVV